MSKVISKTAEGNVLRMLMENTDAQLAYLDNNFNFLKVNSAYAKKSGYKKKDLIGRNHFDLFPNDENQKIFEKVKNTGKAIQFKAKPFIFPNDPERMITYWDWSLTPIKDRHNKNIGLVFSLMDVTTYKRTEESLKRSKSKYKNLFDNMVDAFSYHKMVFNKKGEAVDYIFLEFNKAFEKITGLKRKTAIGQRVTKVLPNIKKSKFDWIKKYGEVAKTGKKMKFERYFEPLDKWFSVSAYCPKKGYFAVTFKDISQWKTVKKKVEHLASFPRFNPEPVLELDFTGKVIFANAATFKTLKKNKLKPDIKLFLPNDITKIIETFKEKHRPTPIFREVQIGDDYLELKIHPLTKLNVIRIYSHNLTGRKKIEIQKDEFFNIASHELKTPLTSIKAFIQLIQRTCKRTCNPQMGHYLERVDVQIDKLTHLINDLLDISKIQSGKLVITKENIKIDNLIEEVIGDIQMTTTSKHKIYFKTRSNALIFGDHYRLSQVLANLLVNAIKYSPEADTINVQAKCKNGMVIISVKDYGLGIAKDKQKQLFQRFYQIQPSQDFLGKFSSLGLGLFISAKIVHDHNGDIWLRSKKGKGSTFYFSLPEKN